MNKIVLIIPYFGKLPNYFQLFLNSCSYNEKIDFLIFTDQTSNIYTFNKNIKFIKMNLTEFKELAEVKIKIKIKHITPYKLCDYRPAYGLIFEDYISKYNYWGFCDCDLLFGDMSDFIKIIICNNYDKILENGHLTLMKNNKVINSLFLERPKNIISFEEAINIKEPCFFDEIFFPVIVAKKNISLYKNRTLFADILPQHLRFKMPQDNIKNQSFIYKNGKVIRENDLKEYIYIHLQKRKMRIDLKNFDYFYINSNNFSNEKQNDKKSPLKYRINYIKNNIKKLNINRIKIKKKVLLAKKG